MTITNREITKTGPFIKTNKLLFINVEENQKAYFEKQNIKEIGDNKTFWKTVRPYFSDKDNISSKITLL